MIIGVSSNLTALLVGLKICSGSAKSSLTSLLIYLRNFPRESVWLFSMTLAMRYGLKLSVE